MNTSATVPPGFFTAIGFLRLMLGVVTLFLAPLAFFAASEPVGWRVLPVYIAPVLVILLFWGIMLDLIMARVFMAEKTPEEAYPYGLAMRFDLSLMFILLAAWGPFFYSLL